MKLAQSGNGFIDWCRWRQVEHHRTHLRAQEVVGAGSAQRCEFGVTLAREEVEDNLAVGEVAHHRTVGRGQPADDGRERCRAGVAVFARQALVAEELRAEGVGAAPVGDERLRRADDLEGVRLALIGRRSPCGDAMPPEDAANRLRIRLLQCRHVEAEGKARTPPWHPRHPVAEALAGQGLAISRSRERNARVGMEMVDVRCIDKRVHRCVDRRRSATGAMQAVAEGLDHLVLAIDTRIHVDERPHAVQTQHGETCFRQGPKIASGPLDPQNLDQALGHGIDDLPLRRRISASEVRVAGIGAKPV